MTLQILKRSTYVIDRIPKSLPTARDLPNGLEKQAPSTDPLRVRTNPFTPLRLGMVTQPNDGRKPMSLRLELRRSQLKRRDFAAHIGVDLDRLEYWLQLEVHRDKLERRGVPGTRAATPIERER